MEINNKLKINEYVSINQLKKKLKAYLIDQGNSEFKPSIFSQGLIVSLVIVLEDLILDCLKNVSKDNKTGLYTLNVLILTNLLNESNKYNFSYRYFRKYSSIVKYHDSVFFNINKVYNNLEIKHGSKLMIDSESKNMISYLILCLQYDIVNLSVNMVKYANRKTLNVRVLDLTCSYLLENDLSNKIKLKLDSINIKNEEDEENEEVEVEVEVEVEEDEEDDEEDKDDEEDELIQEKVELIQEKVELVQEKVEVEVEVQEKKDKKKKKNNTTHA
jgi:hypothetical protein